MNDQQTIQTLRAAFQDKPVVSSSMGGTIFLENDFIMKCVDDVERVRLQAMVGELPTPLERLGLELLFKMAGINDVN